MEHLSDELLLCILDDFLIDPADWARWSATCRRFRRLGTPLCLDLMQQTEEPYTTTTTTTTTTTATTTTTLPHTYSGLDFSDPNWTPVVIRADVEAAMAAGRGLEEVCNGQLDQVVLDVPFPRHRHATVVGKHGLTIAKLSADHNVRIMIPHKDSRHDMIQLEGDLLPVQQCLIDLLQLASRIMPAASLKRDDGATSSGGSNTQQQQEHQVSDSLLVPLAPSQTKIRNVARKTDCSIKKKKYADGWQLFVAGKSAEQVAAGIALFRKWRDDVQKQQQRQSATGIAAQGEPPQQQQQEPQQGDNVSTFNKRRRNKMRGRKKTRTPSSTNEDTN
uniref:K Homology domain-containing protein n=1 Tax=Amphora coffeiformis TaxID=265554 RepID=A0A7S3L1B4_9STRA